MLVKVTKRVFYINDIKNSVIEKNEFCHIINKFHDVFCSKIYKMNIKFTLFQTTINYNRTPILEAKSEDYPEFTGSSEEEFLQYLNDNLRKDLLIEEFDKDLTLYDDEIKEEFLELEK